MSEEIRLRIDSENNGIRLSIDSDNEIRLSQVGNYVVEHAHWGNITGTLANQTDLNTALSGKASSSDLNTHTGNMDVHIQNGERASWNAKEDASNKVTSWSVIPSNVKYPSEKLVKDSIPHAEFTYSSHKYQFNSYVSFYNGTITNGFSCDGVSYYGIKFVSSGMAGGTSSIKYLTIPPNNRIGGETNSDIVDEESSDITPNFVGIEVIGGNGGASSAEVGITVYQSSAQETGWVDEKYRTVNFGWQNLPAAVVSYLESNAVRIIEPSEISTLTTDNHGVKVERANADENGVNFHTGYVKKTSYSPDVKTSAMTQSVGVDGYGKLWADSSTLTSHTSDSTIHVTSGKKTEWDAKYDKPSGGIPYSDLSNGVKGSLDLADSALQEHQSLSAYRTSSAQDIIDQNIREVAEGKKQTYVVSYATNPAFNSQNDTIAISGAVTDIGGASIAIADVQIGDSFYVTELEVPDRWVSSIIESGGSRTGYTLNKLETAKVDLTPYRTSSAQDIIDNGKVAINQGVAHAGKFLVVGNDGNVTTITMQTWQAQQGGY